MPAESLVPGYKLVESFGPDAEYETRPPAGNPEGRVEGGEVEEEVEYVTLEISGISDVDPNLLTSYRLIVSSRECRACSSTLLTVADLDPTLPCHYAESSCSLRTNGTFCSVGPRHADSISPTVKLGHNLQRPPP